MPRTLVPKLVTTLRTYDRSQFGADVVAGVIVGIVAIPLAIAFAIASGVTPERGLITAIVGGFLISALGGSRVQIGGPTGAFVVIVYGIVQQHGVDGLAVATVMAGAILCAMGAFGFGSVIKFVPKPVVIGFTSGIAAIIFSGEVKDLLGLRMGEVPPDFIGKWAAFGAHAGTVSAPATAVAAVTLAVMLLGPRLTRRVPAPFVALVVGTAFAHALSLPVETIGTKFGAVRAALPAPSLPHMSLAQMRELAGPAFTIAMLGAVESLLSAVVSDGMIGGRHRSNMELLAQGVANLASPLFGGIPATGAIARTATNVKSGGRTPVAGMTHALTLLLVTLFFGRWAALIPLAVLAAILVVVAYNMSEWRTFRAELSAPRSDVAVLLTTFLLTILVDLTVAIEVGMVASAFLFMRRMAEVTNVKAFVPEDGGDDDFGADPNAVQRRAVPGDVEVYEVNGPFFFGAAEMFKETLRQVARRPKVLIIRMRAVPAMDSTGIHALRDVVHTARKEGALVLLSDVHTQPFVALSRSAALQEIGEENVYGNLDDALNRARRHLGLAEVPRPAFATPTVARETPAGGTPAARAPR
ncbi:MAG TPA: SulP family inorganic anion transporter [Gemmatimonadaceae bacterium]|nr:SulP family inorganic anion transporter [Gemmatimonadaceae bacterium]